MTLALLAAGCPSATQTQESSETRALRERRDAAVCEQLRAVGSDVSKPHRLEHTFYAATEPRAESAARAAAKLGFEVSKVTFGGGEERPFSFTVYTDTIPEAERVSAVTAKMAALAATHDVEYDGWGASVIPRS